MSKNISINFRFNGMENKGLKIIVGLGDKVFDLFLFVIARTDGDKYLAGVYKDKALSELGISEATYWRQLKKIEDTGLIKWRDRGIYAINPVYAEMFTKVDAIIYAEVKKNRGMNYGG